MLPTGPPSTSAPAKSMTRSAPRAGSFPLPRGMVPLAPHAGAPSLKGPSPPQKCLPSARSLEVPAVPRRSAARHPLPHFHFRAPSSGNGAIDLAERKLRAGKGLEGPGRAAHAHSLAVPSSDPVAKVRPSGPTATERTAAVWPRRAARHWREATSHTLAILSSEPVMSAVPS